ncbi:unnamed protein product [Hyaloperonospora brassicae]|uniref:[Histone H3]-lysine(27) N-trimethyltransferase n=1 Tax=Hyaloperonospora brassicae TaxID=162125 RepID=A0AAV0T2A7_HYABA|nr:unnamed protein product [Hyaloperonospora brassicae]
MSGTHEVIELISSSDEASSGLHRASRRKQSKKAQLKSGQHHPPLSPDVAKVVTDVRRKRGSSRKSETSRESQESESRAEQPKQLRRPAQAAKAKVALSPTAKSASTRPTRKPRGEMQIITEAMSFYELQAQEQMMARFQAQNRKRAPVIPRKPGTSVAAEQAAGKCGNLTRNNGTSASQTRTASKQSHIRKSGKSVVSVRVADGRYESEYDEEEEGEQTETGFTTEKLTQKKKHLRKQKWKSKSAASRVSESGRKVVGSDIPVSRKSSDCQKPGRMQQKVQKMAFAKRSQQQKTVGRSKKQRVVSVPRQSSSSRAGEQESERESDELSGSRSEDGDGGMSMHWRQGKVSTHSKAAVNLSTPRYPKKRSHENIPSASQPRYFCASQASERDVHNDGSETESIVEISSWESQEQEKMFPSLHPQKKGSSSDTSSKEQKAKQNTYGLSSATKSSGSSRRARMGVYQKKTPSFSPSSSSVSPPPSQKGFSAPGARFATDAECTATPVEIPMTPVVHSTTWRRLVVGKAPPNIITGVSARPYSYGFDRPLWTFDTTGVLREKCKFRAVDSDSATAEASIQIQPPSQSEVNERVRCLVDQELPRIKKCHVQRVRHTLKSTRQQLAAYFKGHRELRSERYRRLQWLEIANHRSRSDISAGERVTAKRLLRNSAHIGLPYNCLVGTVRFFVHQDKPPFESVVYPETVIYLPNDITAICQSFAMIGINKNAFVEDDPILRYVPYLGDGQELVVDNDLYSGTTMSRERQIAVFGDNGELKVLKPSARDNEIQEYLLRVIVGTCGASERVFLALEEEVGFSQPRIDYCEMKEQAKAAELTAKRVAKAKKLVALYQKSLIDGQSGHSVGSENASKALFNLAQHCWFLRSTSEHQSFGVRLQPPLSVFESSYADTPEAHGIRDRASYEGLVEWHRDLFCRRCYSYDCSEHGIQNPQRSSRADPIYPMITAPGVVLSMEEAMSREGGIGAKECSSNVVTLSVESEEAIQIAGGESSSSLDDEAQKNKRQPISVDQPSSESAALNRRSRRTQTQLSSMASKSLQSQEKLLDIQRLAKLKKRNKRREMFLRAPDNSEYLDDSYIPAVTAMYKMLQSDEKACGPLCWLSASDTYLSNDCAPLRRIDAVLVRKLASTLGSNACVLSAMIRSHWCTCAQIYKFLAEEKKRRNSGDCFGNDDAVLVPARRQQKGRHCATAGLNRSLNKRVREHCSYDHEKKLSYEPCNHDGVCDATCRCTQRGHSCNKTCSCSRDCLNRFQGCKCSIGKCCTSACPCFSAGRECDPDYCFHCGASDAAVMAFHPNLNTQSCYDLHICCNVNMLRNSIQKRIGVAFSATHGWGAFALESIRKDEFVLEYTGELITDDEAERRGAMYDRKLVSYLFGVNSEYVVDAARKGNKAKFANHRAKRKANLNVKVIVSNGEHRIGLFAREAIEVGAELFFDYGYTHESAPNWSHRGKSMSEQFVHDKVDTVDEENE